MREIGRNLVLLTDELVEEVRSRGMSAGTVKKYRCACNGMLGFAEALGVEHWSDEFESAFLGHLDERLGRGTMCAPYHLFQLRVARMISLLATRGETDFSRIRGGTAKYPVSDELSATVEAILAAKCASDEVRADLRGSVRHLLWYASERGRDPLDIDDALVMDFLVHELPATNAGSSGRALRAVVASTEWLRERDAPVCRDYSMLTLKGGARRIVPAFTEEEVRAVVRSIDASTDGGKRDLAIVLVAYCTGLRGCDILGLRLDEVDWRGQRLTTRQSKTHGTITCALNGQTMNALADYVLDSRPRCDVPEVFVTLHAPHRAMVGRHLSAWFDRLCERAGVEKRPGRSFHSLRRSFETVMVSRGVALETASQMMGHKTVAEDKPYITYDVVGASLVAMGLDDVPVRHGAYSAAIGGDGL